MPENAECELTESAGVGSKAVTELSDKQQALLKRYQPISRAHLKNVVLDYFSAFSGWNMLEDGTGFSRDAGPLRQLIWFQKMSGAQYRPTHVMRTTVLPQPRMLTQLLDVRNRELKLTWHHDKWRKVLAAMEQQFRPSVIRALDVAEVLSLCKAELRAESTNDLVVLAILHAWLGQSAEAVVSH